MASGDNPGSVMGKCNGLYIICMPCEHVQGLSGTDIPDTGGFIIAPRNQPASIWREGKALNVMLVPFQQDLDLAGPEVQEPDKRYVASAYWKSTQPYCQETVIRGKGYGTNLSLISASALAPQDTNNLAG